MKSILLIAGASLLAGVSAASAATVVATLETARDHSGLVEDNQNSYQANRADSLWGSTGGAGSERRGIIEFAIGVGTLVDLNAAGTVINSITLRLLSTSNSWAKTTLEFRQLNDDDQDWVEAGSPTGAVFTRKTTGTAWAGGNGAEASRTGNALLGSLTSTGNGTASTVFDTSFTTGADALAFLNGTNPSLLISEAMAGAGAQTRFATSDHPTIGGPQLIIDYTTVPEPSSALLAGLAGLGLLRRRR